MVRQASRGSVRSPRPATWPKPVGRHAPHVVGGDLPVVADRPTVEAVEGRLPATATATASTLPGGGFGDGSWPRLIPTRHAHAWVAEPPRDLRRVGDQSGRTNSATTGAWSDSGNLSLVAK